MDNKLPTITQKLRYLITPEPSDARYCFKCPPGSRCFRTMKTLLWIALPIGLGLGIGQLG